MDFTFILDSFSFPPEKKSHGELRFQISVRWFMFNGYVQPQTQGAPFHLFHQRFPLLGESN